MEIISQDEFETLVVHRAGTIESQTIRKRLAKSGIRFCGVCVKLLTIDSFGPSKSNPDGINHMCRRCNTTANKDRRRKGMEYFYFTPAERNQRYKGRMTSGELSDYYARSNKRDMDNYRRWYYERSFAGLSRSLRQNTTAPN